MQLSAGKSVEAAARSVEINESTASDITRLSFHLVHDALYEITAYCLRHPKDGGLSPSAEWCRDHVGRRKTEAVISAQESLDGLDDPEKKAEAIRAVMIAAHRSRQIASAGSPLTTGSLPDTD